MLFKYLTDQDLVPASWLKWILFYTVYSEQHGTPGRIAPAMVEAIWDPNKHKQ